MSDTAAIILAALKAQPIGPSITEAAETIAASLDQLGYVVRKKPVPRKVATPAEPFTPDTGDAKLDEFMRVHHDPKRKPLPLPKSAGLPRPARLSDKDFGALLDGWERQCAKRRGDSREATEMRANDADKLRDLIQLHRPAVSRRSNAPSATAEHSA